MQEKYVFLKKNMNGFFGTVFKMVQEGITFAILTGWAITYGNLREIGSRLQTKTGTEILRPFFKCPDFLHPKKYKKITHFAQKRVLKLLFFKAT